MRYVLALAALALASCASLWMDPIHQVGPNTYQVSHTMYAHSPVKGVRQGTIDRATAKCEGMGRTYQKLREEMGTDGALSYVLTFQCISSKK